MAIKTKISAKESDAEKDVRYGFQGNRKRQYGYDPVFLAEYIDSDAVDSFEDLQQIPDKNHANKKDGKSVETFESENRIVSPRETSAIQEPEEKKSKEHSKLIGTVKTVSSTPIVPQSTKPVSVGPKTEEKKESEVQEDTQSKTYSKDPQKNREKDTNEEQEEEHDSSSFSFPSFKSPVKKNTPDPKNPSLNKSKDKPKALHQPGPEKKAHAGNKERAGSSGVLKQHGGKPGIGGGSGGRITDMTNPSKDGGVERNKQKDKVLQQAEQQHLELISGKKAETGKTGISTLGDNEKKKDPANEKLKKTEDAVVEQPTEKVAEVNTKQVEVVSQVTPPEVKEEEPKNALTQSLDAVVPKTIEDVEKFKERGLAGKIGEQVQKTIEGKTQEISGTFEQLAKTEQPGQPKESIPLGEIEKAVPTNELNIGTDLVPQVKEETLNLESYVKESDNLLEREGIKDEHLNMVDSGDLFEARQGRDKLKTKSTGEPEAVRKEEEQVHGETEAHLNEQEQSHKEAMHSEREAHLGDARKDQEDTKSDFEKKREEVTNHINEIYETTNKKVQEKLANLKENALAAFDKEEAEASKAFEENVKTRIDKFKDERYSGFVGAFKWLRDLFLGINDLPEVNEIFESERTAYITRIDAAIERILGESQKVIDECKALIAEARQQIDEYVKSLGPELREIGEEAQQEIQQKLDELDEKVNKAAEELKEALDKKREEAIKKLDDKIAKMKEEMSGLLAQIAKLLIDAAFKFFEWALKSVGLASDQVLNVLNKGKAVITAIVTNPVKFISNLAAAVGGGVRNFGANIMKHLKDGFISWLTGQMSSLPIQMPESFDLKGVFSLTMQLLGLTWANFRARLSNKVGEEKVAMAEKAGEEGLEIVAKVRDEGPSAMIGMMSEEAANIKTEVIEGAKQWAITTIVREGIIKMASMLNPAGAIIQAIIAIYKGVMFLIENWERLMAFVNTVFDSIVAIASGAIAGAAAGIERALASAIPLILDFLAKLLGVGGIVNKIQEIIEKIRGPVDRAIDKVLNFIEAKLKKLWDKVTGKNKKKKKDGKDDDQDDNGVNDKDHKKKNKQEKDLLEETKNKKKSDANKNEQEKEDKKPDDDKQKKEQEKQEKLHRIVKELEPKVRQYTMGGVGEGALRKQLNVWRQQYGLTVLMLKQNGEIIAKLNPIEKVEDLKEFKDKQIGELLLPVFIEFENAYFEKIKKEYEKEYKEIKAKYEKFIKTRPLKRKREEDDDMSPFDDTKRDVQQIVLREGAEIDELRAKDKKKFKYAYAHQQIETGVTTTNAQGTRLSTLKVEQSGAYDTAVSKIADKIKKDFTDAGIKANDIDKNIILKHVKRILTTSDERRRKNHTSTLSIYLYKVLNDNKDVLEEKKQKILKDKIEKKKELLGRDNFLLQTLEPSRQPGMGAVMPLSSEVIRQNPNSDIVNDFLKSTSPMHPLSPAGASMKKNEKEGNADIIKREKAENIRIERTGTIVRELVSLTENTEIYTPGTTGDFDLTTLATGVKKLLEVKLLEKEVFPELKVDEGTKDEEIAAKLAERVENIEKETAKRIEALKTDFIKFLSNFHGRS